MKPLSRNVAFESTLDDGRMRDWLGFCLRYVHSAERPYFYRTPDECLEC